jgi:integrase
MSHRSGQDIPDLEFIGDGTTAVLTYQQQILFADIWNEFLEYLRTEGRDPDRHKGYAESSVRPTARRTLQVYQHQWESGQAVLELTTRHADDFVDKLNKDEIRTNCDKEYTEGSKRKFVNALSAYFRYLEIDWMPPVQFGSNENTLSSDPLTKQERERLLTAACEYKSPPNYKNVTPEERDRWNAQIAQSHGVEKEEIGPQDWEQLQRDWKIPSLISTALDLGARAALIGRLHTGLVSLKGGHIEIPPEIAVKNNGYWKGEISSRTVKLLEKWLPQRQNTVKYDDTDRLWLNRAGNPYDAGSLNTLIENLLEEAEIKQSDRKLTWHSIRHSTGMYVYAETEDLGYVAEVLRQQSLASARQYAHPTPESKTDLIESIQGGER